jgi:hypothetical protein
VIRVVAEGDRDGGVLFFLIGSLLLELYQLLQSKGGTAVGQFFVGADVVMGSVISPELVETGTLQPLNRELLPGYRQFGLGSQLSFVLFVRRDHDLARALVEATVKHLALGKLRLVSGLDLLPLHFSSDRAEGFQDQTRALT